MVLVAIIVLPSILFPAGIQKEIESNKSMFLIQGDRNPFIDLPEFANLIWGDGFAGNPGVRTIGSVSTVMIC